MTSAEIPRVGQHMLVQRAVTNTDAAQRRFSSRRELRQLRLSIVHERGPGLWFMINKLKVT